GGHQAGDVASEMAVSLIQDKWAATEKIVSPDKAEEWLYNVLINVNKSIYDRSKQKEAFKGMGAKIVVTIVTTDFTTIAHIGDSRCYILNESGFSQLTEDHSLVNELVRSGQITNEEARVHPRKNVVLKALGTEEQVETDICSLGWELENKLLLCSDGLTDKISQEELADFMKSEDSILQIGRHLIDIANDRGGEDNISLVIVSHQEKHEIGDQTC